MTLNKIIGINDPYPNKIAECAVISDKYKDLANKLSDEAIKEFLKITKIPRSTGNMDTIQNYMLDWAKTNNKKASLDNYGNIYIDIIASKGHENDKNLIIQAHMDMIVASKTMFKRLNMLGITYKQISEILWLRI